MHVMKDQTERRFLLPMASQNENPLLEKMNTAEGKRAGYG
jgi:hypothetical protein